MRSSPGRATPRSVCTLVVLATALAWCLPARGQPDAAAPRRELSSTPTGSPNDGANSEPDQPASRERQLEDRLRRMENANARILDQLDSLSRQNRELEQRLKASESKNLQSSSSVGRLLPPIDLGGPFPTIAAPPRSQPRTGRGTATRGPIDGGATDGGDDNDDEDQMGLAGDSGGSLEGMSGRASRGVGAQGTDARTFVPESESRGEEKLRKRKALVEFGEGLEFGSDDGEFKLQFHDLTQAEYRLFAPPNSILHSQFFIPRQRWYFTGRVTKNIEFYTVINRGYGPLDLLDAFITYRLDERLRFRVGRMKTPYLYEYYQIAEGDLIAPERSLVPGNLAGNRQDGAMFLGELFKNRMGYAVGLFNGPRRSFQDFNSGKDLFIFLNSRPFLKPTDDSPTRGAEGTGGRTRPVQSVDSGGGTKPAEPGPLEYLNLGGSFNFGREDNPVQPNAFRTANDQTTSATAATLSPTFLTFNNNVVELGERAQWGAHAVWYYRSLMLLAEYGGGFGSYAMVNNNTHVKLPFEGFTVGPTYFLTGERLTRRVNVVKPRHDFRVRNGRITGTGAVEVFVRYSYLNIGKNVFTSGLADPNEWSNQAQTVDLGLNWYLNFYTKIYLDWQHAMFGNPVVSGPGQFERTTNLFWLRFQLFF